MNQHRCAARRCRAAVALAALLVAGPALAIGGGGGASGGAGHGGSVGGGRSGGMGVGTGVGNGTGHFGGSPPGGELRIMGGGHHGFGGRFGGSGRYFDNGAYRGTGNDTDRHCFRRAPFGYGYGDPTVEPCG